MKVTGGLRSLKKKPLTNLWEIKHDKVPSRVPFHWGKLDEVPCRVPIDWRNHNASGALFIFFAPESTTDEHGVTITCSTLVRVLVFSYVWPCSGHSLRCSVIREVCPNFCPVSIRVCVLCQLQDKTVFIDTLEFPVDFVIGFCLARTNNTFKHSL